MVKNGCDTQTQTQTPTQTNRQGSPEKNVFIYKMTKYKKKNKKQKAEVRGQLIKTKQNSVYQKVIRPLPYCVVA